MTIHNECPRCKSHTIIFEPAETYCKNCGLVLQGTPDYTHLYPVEYPFGVLL